MQTQLFNATEELPLEGAHVELHRAFLPLAQADALYQHLCSTLDWQQPEIVVAGKRHRIPRLQAWYGDAQATYTYSKRTFVPKPWTAALAGLRSRLQQTCQAPLNSVLANWYRDGADGMGFHGDNEPELGAQPVIASVSLGASRRFVFKPADAADKHRYELELGSGDLVIMAGDTQKNWRHGVPKTRKPVAGRINLTFRYVQAEPI